MRPFSILLLSAFLLTVLVGTVHSQEFREPLKTGTAAPDFSGTDQYGKEISLSAALENGHSAVLIFYRGSWCPHCVKHLSKVQDSLSMILDAGASVIVVSPEQPEYAEKMISETGAEFSVIQDKDYSIMKNYQVDFVIAKETVPRAYSFVERRTAESNGNDDGMLPVPATYVIDSAGIITWVQYDPDYRNRSSVAGILQALE